MKFLSSLLGGLLLLGTMTGAFAATHAKKAAPAPATQPAAAPEAPVPAPTPVPAAAPAPPSAPQPSMLDDYIEELTATLKLNDADKKVIEGYYTTDETALKTILGNDSLSSLQKAQQVSDLRDARNAKIDDLLHDLERQKLFYENEAIYRVALIEAIEDELKPPPPAPDATTLVPSPAPVAPIVPGIPPERPPVK